MDDQRKAGYFRSCSLVAPLVCLSCFEGNWSKRMSRRNLAIVSLVLVMGVWGSAFTITKAAGIPPVLLALLRFGLASAILLPLALVRRGRGARPPAGAREWRIVAAMGLCGFTLNQAGAN